MSEYFIKRRHNGAERKVHKEGCFQLNGDAPVSEATEAEIGNYGKCQWCFDGVDNSGEQGEQLAAKLKRMGES